MKRISGVSATMVLAVAVYFAFTWGTDAWRVFTSPTFGLDDATASGSWRSAQPVRPRGEGLLDHWSGQVGELVPTSARDWRARSERDRWRSG